MNVLCQVDIVVVSVYLLKSCLVVVVLLLREGPGGEVLEEPRASATAARGISYVAADLDRLSDEGSEYDPAQDRSMSDCSDELLSDDDDIAVDDQYFEDYYEHPDSQTPGDDDAVEELAGEIWQILFGYNDQIPVERPPFNKDNAAQVNPEIGHFEKESDSFNSLCFYLFEKIYALFYCSCIYL